MALLLETIRIEDGQICNIEWHNRRFNHSRQALLGLRGTMDLASLIPVPRQYRHGTFRCRVLYGEEIEEIRFIRHTHREIRSLKMVHMNAIDYAHKFANRDLLNALLMKKGECDEVLIIKQGFVTDTSISNIAFRTQDGQWHTPDTPLLPGTMRGKLLHEGRIVEARVRPEDLSRYHEARIINCMTELDASPSIPIGRIIP